MYEAATYMTETTQKWAGKDRAKEGAKFLFTVKIKLV